MLSGPHPSLAALPRLAVQPAPPTPSSDTRRPDPELVEWTRRQDGRLTRTQYRFRPMDGEPLPPVEPDTRRSAR